LEVNNEKFRNPTLTPNTEESAHVLWCVHMLGHWVSTFTHMRGGDLQHIEYAELQKKAATEALAEFCSLLAALVKIIITLIIVSLQYYATIK